MEDNWMPIESAPKDGTNILVWDKSDEQPEKCFWNKSYGWCVWLTHDELGFPLVVNKPDYWMPLPKAPNQ